MQISRFSVCLLLLFVVCGMAAAQPYNVRVTYNTNLRASYSLKSRIIDTVPAGTTLQVIGRFNRWLNISRDGNFWMADWAPHARVDGGATSRVDGGATSRVDGGATSRVDGGATSRVDGGATTSDVNNCCFVNRQCKNDQEWLDGYWAFQRNECPAAASTMPATAVQPDNNSQAGVNNCCFVGWQCNSDDDWVRGYWAYRNKQCDASATGHFSSRHGDLLIEGSETFHIWVNAGLELLRTKAPRWYRYVINATRKIKEMPPGAGAGVYVASGIHVTAWDPNSYPSELNIYTIAYEMVHEACHIYQHKSGYSAETWRHEKQCMEKQLAATRAFNPGNRFDHIQFAQRIIANIEDPSTWWWD